MSAKILIAKDRLEEMYHGNGLTQREMAVQLGISEMTVHRLMKEHAIPATHRYRKFACRDDYFDTWSPKMAYILGFIACDAWIHTRNGLTKSLRIDLQSSDVEVLEFIVSEICPGAPIRYRSRFDKRTGNTYHQAHLRLQSKRLIASLRMFGVTERKTGHEFVPVVPDLYKPDYLRGVIDGDGCIYVGKVVTGGKTYMKARLQITSASLRFLQELQEHFLLGSGRIVAIKQSCYAWTNERRKEIIAILSCVYDGGFCLQRKFLKFMEILDYEQRMSDNRISLGSCRSSLIGST